MNHVLGRKEFKKQTKKCFTQQEKSCLFCDDKKQLKYVVFKVERKEYESWVCNSCLQDKVPSFTRLYH